MNIQKPGLGRRLVVASAWLSLAGAAWADDSSITVYGTSTYPYDVEAVQAALDNPAYDKVVLDGIFDFGADGGVQITRPNMTLTGPATILGGGKQIEHPWVWWWWYAVEVAAVNTKVEYLTFVDVFDAAILVHLFEDGDGHVEISGNSVTGCWAGIVPLPAIDADVDDISIDIHDNTVSDCFFGILVPYFAPFTYPISIRNNRIENIFRDGIQMFEISAPLDIVDNHIVNAALQAVFIGSWFVGGETDPEYGDNPPAYIIGNTIESTIEDAGGIMVGTSASGINNVLVKHNVLRGVMGYGGLMKQPYGSNNRFIGNDLSELMTYGPQIWITGGRDNVFINNKLGKTEAWNLDWIEGALFEETGAILSSTANWHLNDLGTPDPVNSGNIFIANDFRETGLPGWNDAYPDNAGAVLLMDFVQRYTAEWVPYAEPFTTENFVVELGKFPTVDGKKTHVCTQVRDMSNLYADDLVPGTNHVTGWRRCEGPSKNKDDKDSD